MVVGSVAGCAIKGLSLLIFSGAVVGAALSGALFGLVAMVGVMALVKIYQRSNKNSVNSLAQTPLGSKLLLTRNAHQTPSSAGSGNDSI
jgi:hypothetical protein